MKYWDSRRIRREKERREQRAVSAYTKSLEHEARKRVYTKGESRKNARLIFDALGSALHRRMLARLRTGGAMSVSHLAEPFNIMLPDAMRHVHILERAGLIATKKHGRIRFCIYNPAAAKELAAWLGTREPFKLD
ncbi:MAG: helix-turn-helix domain-containing protein [Patescibacteria group bacterium]